MEALLTFIVFLMPASPQISWADSTGSARAPSRYSDPEFQIQLNRGRASIPFIKELALRGKGAKKSIPLLKSLLSSSDSNVTVEACSALAQIDPESQDIAEAIADLLQQSQPQYKKPGALAALRQMHPEATESIIPKLIYVLDYNYYKIRELGADALAVHGERAKAALPALEKVLTEAYPARDIYRPDLYYVKACIAAARAMRAIDRQFAKSFLKTVKGYCKENAR